MDAVYAEFITYIIKFVVFAALAVSGFAIGAAVKKKKDSKASEEK